MEHFQLCPSLALRASVVRLQQRNFKTGASGLFAFLMPAQLAIGWAPPNDLAELFDCSEGTSVTAVLWRPAVPVTFFRRLIRLCRLDNRRPRGFAPWG